MFRIMASIARKHFYRFRYLKSDHWQDLRLRKLVSVDAKCQRCGHRDLSNDIHHLRYKKLYDVELSDLIVLCRKCHEIVHEALDSIQKSIEEGIPTQEAQWIAFRAAWGKSARKNPELWAVARDIRTQGKSKEQRAAENAPKLAAIRDKHEFQKALRETRLMIATSEHQAQLAANPPKPVDPPPPRKKFPKKEMPQEVRWMFAALRKAGFFKPSAS